MKTKVSVTREIIAQGKPLEPTSCPIALALLATGLFSRVSVGVSCIYVLGKGRPDGAPMSAIDYPSGVRQSIIEFDHTGKMEPFAFPITIEDSEFN